MLKMGTYATPADSVGAFANYFEHAYATFLRMNSNALSDVF